MFPAFFVYFSNFLKKIKKSACNLPESKIYYASRLTRPVGQGVKTSPSHGENTSSILVLAAKNFRSNSEVFSYVYTEEATATIPTVAPSVNVLNNYFFFTIQRFLKNEMP